MSYPGFEEMDPYADPVIDWYEDHEPKEPWEVHTVELDKRGRGIHVQGFNHYKDGESFSWRIDEHGLAWSYTERYGRFRRAKFGPGARARLDQLLALSRK